MKIKAYKGLFVVSLILLLGTAGALDFGSITLLQSVVQGLIFASLLFFSKHMLEVEYDREDQREELEQKIKKFKETQSKSL